MSETAPKKRSLIQIYFVSLMVVSVLPLAAMGYFWISNEYSRFNDETSVWRQSYVDASRSLLKREVDKAYDYIDVRRKAFGAELTQELRQQVATALSLTRQTHSRSEQRSGANRKETLEAVASALSAIRFSNGAGFFFATDGKRQMLLPILDPATGQRSGDSSVAQQILEQLNPGLGRGSTGEVRYALSSGSQIYTGISFVYYYRELDIYIGASMFELAALNRLQSDILERLSALPYDPNSSVLFVTDASATQLVNPYNPEQLGQPISGLAKQLNAGWPGSSGAFTQFSWARTDTNTLAPTEAYVRTYPDWGWVLGASFFLDEFTATIEQQRQGVLERVQRNILFIVLIILVLLLVAMLAARWLARANAKAFAAFQTFFDDASQFSTEIDVEKLPFSEFEQLAQNANHMVRTRSATQKALEASQQRFQLALDAAQNHLWEFDIENQELHLSESFYLMLGIADPPESLNPDELKRMDHGLRLDQAWKAFADLEFYDGAHLDFEVTSTSGRQHWIFARGDAVEMDGDGEPVRAMGVMIDISDRKRMEEDLVVARINAEDANHAKSQFLSGVSHELRTPLNGVLGYTQLMLADADLAPDLRSNLVAIESCGRHLLDLVNDVLDLARLESGGVQVKDEVVRLMPAMDNIADIVSQRASVKGLSFNVKAGDTLPQYIYSDELRLRQILLNLLDNAVKYTEQGGVSFEIKRQGESLIFAVSDTGRGIAKNDYERIFEPFKRVEENDGLGTGLGLAICKRLAAAMGGELRVQSELELGSTFTLELPCRDAEPELDDPAESVPEVSQFDLGFMRSKSVLVVDDSAINRRILVGMLGDISPDLREASNTDEALAELNRRPADIVFTDYDMPGDDGLFLTRVIRNKAEFAHAYIVLVSAHLDEGLKNRASEAGCVAALPKPVSFADLLSVIAEIEVPATVSQESELPDDLQQKLMSGLSRGDVVALHQILESGRRDHPECAEELTTLLGLVNQFDFDGIRARLQRSAKLVSAASEASE